MQQTPLPASIASFCGHQHQAQNTSSQATQRAQRAPIPHRFYYHATGRVSSFRHAAPMALFCALQVCCTLARPILRADTVHLHVPLCVCMMSLSVCVCVYVFVCLCGLLGMRHGKGMMQYASGDVYRGDWKWGLRHGEGKLDYHFFPTVAHGFRATPFDQCRGHALALPHTLTSTGFHPHAIHTKRVHIPK